MTPVGCAVGPPITGQLNLEGIPVLGLVNTGASVTCMGLLVWWQYYAQWGPLKPFEGVVHGTHGKPLQITGKTQLLSLQWGEARGRASFIVIISLESPPVFIGMDIMHPLLIWIDVTNGTTTPAQPNPQTIHLKTSLPPATLCCYKPVTSPPRQSSWPVATTHGPARISTFAQKKACPLLCPECLSLPVDLKYGSRSTTTAPSRSACEPGQLWVP